MYYGKRKRVKLLVDLTKYHPNLTIGQEGTLIPDVAVGTYGRCYDRFGAVRFDCGAYLDIVMTNLKIIEDK